jgi:tetratricopeptide (TPR) repeat protein
MIGWSKKAACVLAATTALEAQTGSSAAHIGKGYELVQNQRYAEAAEQFRAALALDPKALNARYQLAICLFALGDREQSRKEFERLRLANGDDPAVEYYLARLDLLGNDNNSAIRRLEPVMADPPFPDAAFYLGCAYLAKGDATNAARWLRKAAETDPRDFRVHYRLARALQQDGRNAEAEAEYALSSKLRESYNETARQSVDCSQALRTRPLVEAREVCQRIFDPNDPDKLTTLGMLYGENGKYEQAVEPLGRAAALDTDSFEVHHNLGLSYFRLKRYAEARAPLEKAVRLRPDYFGSNALLGAALYALKDDEAAFRALDMAHRLKLEDADTSELLFRECVILGNRRAAAKDYEAALRLFEKGAELHPGAPEVARRIAELRQLTTPPRQ